MKRRTRTHEERMAQTWHLYRVRGNRKPMRLGKVFPTGWTILDTAQPDADGWVLVASSYDYPYEIRGTTVERVGTITVGEIIARHVRG